jgi:hypothetical protein
VVARKVFFFLITLEQSLLLFMMKVNVLIIKLVANNSQWFLLR